MPKLNFEMKNIHVKIDDMLMSGNKLTKKVLEEMVNQFEKLPMEEKIKLIGSVKLVNEDSDLTLQNVKVGQMVETVKDGILGIVTKINRTKIVVKTAKGELTGSPGAFKSSKKKVETFRKSLKKTYLDEVMFEGTFVLVKYKDNWEKGLTLSDISSERVKKGKILLYEKDLILTPTTTQMMNKEIVKLNYDK